MPDRLRNLIVNRVALVPAGDNPGAHIVLWKSAATTHTASNAHNVTVTTPEVRMEKEPRLTQGRMGRLREAWASLGTLIDETGGRKEDGMTEEQKQLPDDLPQDVRDHIAKVEGERDEALAKIEASKATPVVEETDPVTKALEVPGLDPVLKEAIEKAQAEAAEAKVEAAEAKAEVEKARTEREVAEATERAKAFKHLSVKPEEFGPVLHKIAGADPEVGREIERVLTAANAVASEAFREIGKDNGEPTEGTRTLATLADEYAKANSVTKEQAMTEVIRTPEGRAAYRASEDERKEG